MRLYKGFYKLLIRGNRYFTWWDSDHSLVFRGNRFQWWALQRLKCWFGKHINNKIYEGKVGYYGFTVVIYDCTRCHTKFWIYKDK